MWFMYGLKAQKLLAQGIALGIMAISDAPCKGKSFKIHLIKIENPLRYVKLLPLQGVLLSHKQKPRALPWAKSFCPFRACCFYELLPFQGVLLLRTFALTGRAALAQNKTQGVALGYELLPLQGVLLLRTSALYLCFTLRPAIFNSATCR